MGVHCPGIPINCSGEASDTKLHSFTRPETRLRNFQGLYQGLVSRADIEGGPGNQYLGVVLETIVVVVMEVHDQLF